MNNLAVERGARGLLRPRVRSSPEEFESDSPSAASWAGHQSRSDCQSCDCKKFEHANFTERLRFNDVTLG